MSRIKVSCGRCGTCVYCGLVRRDARHAARFDFGDDEVPEVVAPAVKRPPLLTVGMPTIKDYHGVFFTVEALRLYQHLPIEILVVDTLPTTYRPAQADGTKVSEHALMLRQLGCATVGDYHVARLCARVGASYRHEPGAAGTAAAKNKVFEHAAAPIVMCLDCHVLLKPGATEAVLAYFDERPASRDMAQGPLLHDNQLTRSTHFDPAIWSKGMWGRWAYDKAGYEAGVPFEIKMSGMGLFAMRKAAWPGFHPEFTGFGGEEGYIQEKVRQHGGKVVCVPQAEWVHRFHRPEGVPYRVNSEDTLRNYLLGFRELGLDPAPVFAHWTSMGMRVVADRVWNEINRIGLAPP